MCDTHHVGLAIESRMSGCADFMLCALAMLTCCAHYFSKSLIINNRSDSLLIECHVRLPQNQLTRLGGEMRPPVDFGRSSRDSDRYLKLMIFMGIVRGTTEDITAINWVDFDVVRPGWISNVDHGRQRKERNKGWRIWHQFSTQMYQNQANGLHNNIAGRTVLSLQVDAKLWFRANISNCSISHFFTKK